LRAAIDATTSRVSIGDRSDAALRDRQIGDQVFEPLALPTSSFLRRCAISSTAAATRKRAHLTATSRPALLDCDDLDRPDVRDGRSRSRGLMPYSNGQACVSSVR
jgi:hypothetical protein